MISEDTDTRVLFILLFFIEKSDNLYKPQNRIYLDDMYEPLPNAPIEIINSFNNYKFQICKIKNKISAYVLKADNS